MSRKKSTRANTPENPELFERVWALAQDQGVRTFSQLANQMKVSRSTICLLAQGKRHWSSATILKAAAALGVTRAQLLGSESLSSPAAPTAPAPAADRMANVTLSLAVPVSDLPRLLAFLDGVQVEGPLTKSMAAEQPETYETGKGRRPRDS